MLKFTLMKNLYFELDPEKREGVVEKLDRDIRYRKLPLDLPELPDVHSITMQERYLPRSTMYYLYVNDERMPAEITETPVKELILAFYRKYEPDYLKEDIPEDLSNVNILDCFDVDRMPGYQKRFAYHEIQTLEDIRNGKVQDEHHGKPTFPGLEFSKKYRRD